MSYLVKSSKAFKISVALLTLFVAFCSAPNFQEITHLLFVHEQGISHTHEHVHKDHIHIHHHHDHDDEDLPISEHSHTHHFASLLDSSPILLTHSNLKPLTLFKLYQVYAHSDDTFYQKPYFFKLDYLNRAPPITKNLQQFLYSHPTHAPPLV